MVQFTYTVVPLKDSNVSTQQRVAAFSGRDLWSFPLLSATLQDDILSYKYSLKVTLMTSKSELVVKVNCNRPMSLSESQCISHNSSKL